LECDGTEVDEDETLEAIGGQAGITEIMLLRVGESWGPKDLDATGELQCGLALSFADFIIS